MAGRSWELDHNPKKINATSSRRVASLLSFFFLLLVLYLHVADKFLLVFHKNFLAGSRRLRFSFGDIQKLDIGPSFPFPHFLTSYVIPTVFIIPLLSLFLSAFSRS